MTEPTSPMPMTFVLIELTPGKASIGLRIGQSRTVQILDGWENLDPREAARIVADILHKKIPPQVVADKDYREVTLPAHYWKQINGHTKEDK